MYKLSCPVYIGQSIYVGKRNKEFRVVYIEYNGSQWFINIHWYKDKDNFKTLQFEASQLNKSYYKTEPEYS